MSKNNTDLFKEAIAEAKTVRQAAVENAKSALEDQISPQIKNILKEYMEDEDDNYEEDENSVSEEDTETSDGTEEMEDSTPGDEEISDDTEVENMTAGDLRTFIQNIISQEIGDSMQSNDDESSEEEEVSLNVDDEEQSNTGEEYSEEEDEINLDEILDEMSEEDVEEKQDPAHKEDPSQGTSSVIQKAISAARQSPELAKKLYAELEKLGVATGQAMRNEDSETSETLQEAVKTIKNLKKQLNEVNVFNSKLLYLNKILKKQNLSEQQTVDIITAFDDAETVKEAKLIYKTLVGKGISNSKKNSKQKVVESNLGFASKATGVPGKKFEKKNDKEVLTESQKTVNRLQKLAGIKK